MVPDLTGCQRRKFCQYNGGERQETPDRASDGGEHRSQSALNKIAPFITSLINSNRLLIK